MWENWSSGCDWVTATATPRSGNIKHLEEFGLKQFCQMRNAGMKLVEQKRGNYTGIYCDGLFLGEGNDGLELQASSEAAHHIACKLAEALPDINISRMDAEATARCLEEAYDHEYQMFLYLLDTLRDSKREVGSVWDMRKRRKTGDTLELGSRTSAIFVRLYNKSKQQKNRVAPGLHRAEVEYKEGRAKQVWELFKAAQDKVQVCHDLVTSELHKRNMPYDWLGKSNTLRLPTLAHETSNDKTLRWFRDIVSLSYERLCQDGLEKEAQQALRMTRNVT